jgi:6-phosphogluconolactonase
MEARLFLQFQPTPEEIARAAATGVLGLLMRRSPEEARPFGIALSGGRIAVPFYKEIVENARRARVSFEGVHFFWADERCVPPDSSENNYSVAKEHLFDPLRIPEPNIHRIRGEDDPSIASRDAEAEICRVLPLTNEGEPMIDLVILGMGEDGHVASLFPAEGPEWLQDSAVYRPVIATKPPPQRVTLGYKAIIAARDVWILASGPGKESAFRALLREDQNLPAARVVRSRDETRIFQDIDPKAN